MDVLYDVEFMLLYDGTAFVPQIKAQEGKQLVVKGLRDAHVFDRYLDVVNDRFHYLVSPSLSTARVLRNSPFQAETARVASAPNAKSVS